MDNLRPLSRSLPSQAPLKSMNASTNNTASTTATPDILQSFKDAALSVTKLYKSAANSAQIAREAGYQEALDDLLVFLDREDLGLDDGEGWRVRQWATERLDSGDGNSRDEEDIRIGDETEARRTKECDGDGDGDGEAESEDGLDGDGGRLQPEEERCRRGHTAPLDSSHPSGLSRSNILEPSHPSIRTCSPPSSPIAAAASIRLPTGGAETASHTQPLFSSTPSTPQANRQPNNHELFTFRAPAPSGVMDMDDAPTLPSALPTSRPHAIRRKHGYGHAHSRSVHVPLTRERDRERIGLGSGAGAKRKFAIADFFDLGDLNVKDFAWGKDGRDGNGGGGGGGKKGRLS